jgi:hypothetical protein
VVGRLAAGREIRVDRGGAVFATIAPRLVPEGREKEVYLEHRAGDEWVNDAARWAPLSPTLSRVGPLTPGTYRLRFEGNVSSAVTLGVGEFKQLSLSRAESR